MASILADAVNQAPVPRFSPSMAGGITAIVVCGAISFSAVVAFLIYMTIQTAMRLRSTAHKTSLMGTAHMTAYFYCTLIANVFKSLSVLMSARWLSDSLFVHTDKYCTAQAVFKLVGNAGSSLWSMVIAIHVFNLLFLNLKPIRWGLPGVIVAVWSVLLVDVLVGPVIIQSKTRGPFFGFDADDTVKNGVSCWITGNYSIPRFLLEYLPTGLSLFVSTCLLLATLLLLRGNLYFTNGRFKVRWINSDDAWHNKMMRDEVDEKILATVKRMILFPISYFVLWSPIMVSRLMDLSGDNQPFGFAAFSLSTYALTGFADVAIFLLTRSIIIPDGVVTPVYADVEKQFDFGDEKKTAPLVSAPLSTAPPPYMQPPRPLVLRPEPGNRRRPSVTTANLGTAASLPAFAAPNSAYLAPEPLSSVSYGGAGPRAGVTGSPASDVSMIVTGTRYSSPSTARTNFLSMGERTPASRPTNFLSVGSDTPRDSVASTGAGEEFPQHRILSAYALPSAPAARGLGAATMSSAHRAPPSIRSIPESAAPSSVSDATMSTGFDILTGGGASAGTLATRADKNAGLVEPVAPAETYKARLYGARFSLVAGPAPAYNYDRGHAPVENVV